MTTGLTGKHVSQYTITAPNAMAREIKIIVNTIVVYCCQLVPLLLLCLDQPGNASHSQTLTTLCSAVVNAPDVVTQSVDSLIDHLLLLTKNDSSMVRTCLYVLLDRIVHGVYLQL